MIHKKAMLKYLKFFFFFISVQSIYIHVDCFHHSDDTTHRSSTNKTQVCDSFPAWRHSNRGRNHQIWWASTPFWSARSIDSSTATPSRLTSRFCSNLENRGGIADYVGLTPSCKYIRWRHLRNKRKSAQPPVFFLDKDGRQRCDKLQCNRYPRPMIVGNNEIKSITIIEYNISSRDRLENIQIIESSSYFQNLANKEGYYEKGDRPIE